MKRFAILDAMIGLLCLVFCCAPLKAGRNILIEGEGRSRRAVASEESKGLNIGEVSVFFSMHKEEERLVALALRLLQERIGPSFLRQSIVQRLLETDGELGGMVCQLEPRPGTGPERKREEKREMEPREGPGLEKKKDGSPEAFKWPEIKFPEIKIPPINVAPPKVELSPPVDQPTQELLKLLADRIHTVLWWLLAGLVTYLVEKWLPRATLVLRVLHDIAAVGSAGISGATTAQGGGGSATPNSLAPQK